MSITFPITAAWTAKPRHVQFRASSVVGVSTSPFTYETQVYVHQGECWHWGIQLPPLSRALAEDVVGDLLALNGREGTLIFGIETSPRGVATGTPLVKGAAQSGKTLLTDGWTAGITGILKKGDWFQLGTGSGTHLHKIVRDADSDGSGNATLEIRPRLRTAPADNAALTLFNPKGHWRLASNDTDWDLGLAQRYGVAFDLDEAGI